MKKTFTYPCSCRACDRPLKDTFHTTTKEIRPALNWSDETYICTDCWAVLDGGDAVIIEAGENGMTTGAMSYVDLTTQPQHVEFWKENKVLPGRITIIHHEVFDEIIRQCHSRLIRAHHLTSCVEPHVTVRRAFRKA